MCLTRVTSTKTKTKKDGSCYIGYKVVVLSKTGKTFSSLYNVNRSFLKWLKSRSNNEIEAKDNKLYKNGFHVWTSKKAAQKYKQDGEIICYVLFTKIIAEGIEDIYNLNKHEIDYNYRCVVTDKIFVLPPNYKVLKKE